MKFSARFDWRRGRTRRSPRMSCSVMTATSAVSKPESRPSTASATCGPRQRQRLRPRRHRREVGKAVLGQHMRPCARASLRSTSATTARLPAPCSASTCLVTASKTFLPGSLRSAVKFLPARAAISMASAVPSRRRERRQPGERRLVQAFAPLGLGQIKPIRRQRLIGRAAACLVERCAPRLVIVGDLRQALVRGVFGERFERDGRARPDNRTASPCCS